MPEQVAAVSNNDASFLDALTRVMRGVSNSFGQDFYNAVTISLAETINADFTFIGRFDDNLSHSHTLALCSGTELIDNFEYALSGTPCAKVAEESTCVYPSQVCEAFPFDQLLIDMGVEGYIGAPLLNRQHKVIGLVVALYKNEIENPVYVQSIFELFAGRIAAEIENTEAAKALEDLNQTLEQKVLLRTEELSEANEELKAFSYSLSHDLRAPLRATSGLVSVIREDYIEQLSPEAQLYFDEVDKSCLHMTTIIEDMLKLANLSSKALQFDSVNVTEQCERIVARLRAYDSCRTVDVELGSDMMLYGDEALVNIMLENIIGNAWKYSANNDQAKIAINLQEKDNFCRLIISDNGAGFDMSQAGDIFQPFSRMHSDQEYQGSGVGLSTVKRVVDRHGAKIQLQSAPNRGTTVTLEWPLAPKSQQGCRRILVIEDNTIDFMLVSRLIKKHLGDVSIFRAEDSESCRELLQQSWPLVISDCHIKDADAPEIVSWIEQSNCSHYLLLSGSPEEYRIEQFDLAPLGLLNKSDVGQIGMVLETVIGH